MIQDMVLMICLCCCEQFKQTEEDFEKMVEGKVAGGGA
jgi:hypothetical protein